VMAADTAISTGMLLGDATQENEPPLPQRRFTVYCRGHWRIRASPSLHAETLGSLASGVVLVGIFLDEGVHNGTPVEDGGPERWVRVVRFESARHDGVHIKKSPEEQADMYCYWRNMRGHGLYEVGGGCPTRSPRRLRRGRAAASQEVDTEAEGGGVSMTWRILGHVESLVQTFSQLSAPQESGSIGALDPDSPGDVFSRRQHEQLKDSARRLRKAAGALAAAAGRAGLAAPAAGLPPDVHRRLAGLSSQLAAYDHPVQSADAGSSQERSHDAMDFQTLVRACCQLERGSLQVSRELRAELVAFDQRHTRDLEERTRALLKACCSPPSADGPRPPPSPALSAASTAAPDSPAGLVASAPPTPARLPAPPPPAWGLLEPPLLAEGL